jgi:hypothetical protein
MYFGVISGIHILTTVLKGAKMCIFLNVKKFRRFSAFVNVSSVFYCTKSYFLFHPAVEKFLGYLDICGCLGSSVDIATRLQAVQ